MSSGGILSGVNRVWGRADLGRYSDLELSEVEFDNCHFPESEFVGLWNLIQNIKARDITNFNSTAETVCFDEVSVHNLKRAGRLPLCLGGCVFRHVILSGKVGLIKFNRAVGASPSNEKQAAWDDAVMKFYNGVDWALDISEAQFSSGMNFEAIPGDKIRINPRHQAVIRRERLESSDLTRFDFDGTTIDMAISWFLRESLFDSVVVAASTANRKWAAREIGVIERLRDATIAEPHDPLT